MKKSIKPKLYIISKTVKFTKQQSISLNILKSHGINIQQFIRDAVKEKLMREWKNIKENNRNNKYPF